MDKQQAAEAFGLSEIDIKTILDKCLKPEEISGDTTVQHTRIKELVRWFRRYIDGNANPKWFQSHAFELVYYIATEAGNRFIDTEAIRRKAFYEGVNITPGERQMLEFSGLIPTAAPAPPAVGPVNKTKEEILRSCLNSYSLKIGDLPSNVEMAILHSMDKYAQQVAPQPPAGPVWVKASVHVLPKHENEVFIRYSKGRDKVIGYRSLIVELIENGWKDVEYLDETAPAQQLFTREQVEPKNDLGICSECKKEPATKDYNGHKHFVCDSCYDSLTRYFESEYQ